MQLKINKQNHSVWNFEGQMTAVTIAENWGALTENRPVKGVWTLHFDAVTHMDSAGLAFLLDCLRSAEVSAVKIQLGALPISVKQLIQVQGLGPLLSPHMKKDTER